MTDWRPSYGGFRPCSLKHKHLSVHFNSVYIYIYIYIYMHILTQMIRGLNDWRVLGVVLLDIEASMLHPTPLYSNPRP